MTKTYGLTKACGSRAHSKALRAGKAGGGQ